MRTTVERNSRSGGSRGFTLIEMLVVIIIIAVLSSVTVPRYYDFAMKARFQESVQKVLSVFADARYKAIQTGADCVVRYDAQSATFVVESEAQQPSADQPVAMQDSADNLASLPSAPTQLGENVIVNDFQVDSSQRQQQQNQARPDQTRQLEIHFYEDGRADAALIMLVSAEGDHSAIEISPVTGRAAIREDQP